MNGEKAVSKGRIIAFLAVLVPLAFFLGYYLRGRAQPAPVSRPEPPAGKQEVTVWTCSMHPQIRLPNPGLCPICSMPLIPAGNGTTGDESGASHLELSEHARAMASVETVVVTKRKLSRELRAVGKVQYNETSLASVTTRVDGYVERLFVDYTGIQVNTGDHLVELYSPDLVNAQNELLLAMESKGLSMAEAVKLKLRRWGITEEQVDKLIKERKPTDRVTIYSPVKGTIVEKMIVERSFVKAGDTLYRLANLDSVWVNLDIYEYELAWVRYGQRVEIQAEAYPGISFKGLVTFINPVLSEETRTVKVRVNVSNLDRKLKPGMFVSTVVRARLGLDGQAAPTGVEGQYTCPMHPDIIQLQPGNCPLCGMKLEQLPGEKISETSGEQDPAVLAVPVSAVLDSGVRKLVYVERSQGRYEGVEVVTGPRAGDYFPVLKGLSEHDAVAVRGNFLIDSQFQIRGMPSLLNKEGAAPVKGHGEHGGSTPSYEPKSGGPGEKTDHSGHGK